MTEPLKQRVDVETPLPTRADRALAVEIQSLQEADPLPELRKQAEAYRNALLALTTIVTAAWIVSGVTTAKDLTPDRRLIVGSCLGVAFVLLLVGSVWSMRAAFGSLKPKVLTTTALLAERRREYEATLRAVRVGRVAIIVAVLLMGSALATAFFNPTALTKPIVQVVHGDSTACGTLVGATSEHVTLETVADSGDKQTLRVKFSSLAALRPVSECP